MSASAMKQAMLGRRTARDMPDGSREVLSWCAFCDTPYWESHEVALSSWSSGEPLVCISCDVNADERPNIRPTPKGGMGTAPRGEGETI